MGSPINQLTEAAALLQQVMESSRDLIFVKDRAGKYVACNEAYGKLFKAKPEDLIGHGIEVYGDPEVTKRINAIDNELFETGIATHERGPRADAMGNVRWFDVVKSPLFAPDGAVTGFTCVARDVTRQHLVEERLENQNSWLSDINTATVAMIRSPETPTDIDCLLKSLAKLTGSAFAALYLEPGLTTAETSNSADNSGSSGHPGSSDDLMLRGQTGETVIGEDQRVELAEFTMDSLSPQSLSGSNMHAIPLNDADARNGVLVAEWQTDPTEETLALLWAVARQLGVLLINKSLLDQTKYRSTHDELTGLANRRNLTNQLEAAMTRRGSDGSPVAVLFGDLDGFKDVNDKWGHHIGDLLLQQVAKRLELMTRSSDTLARLGGDEFALVIPNGTEETCNKFVDRIALSMAQPFDIGVGEQIHMGLSIGLARTPGDGVTSAELMIAADKAMYANKAVRQAALASDGAPV